MDFMELEQRRLDKLGCLAILENQRRRNPFREDDMQYHREQMRAVVLQQQAILHEVTKPHMRWAMVSKTRLLNLYEGARHALLGKVNHAPHTAVANEAYTRGYKAALYWKELQQ